MASQADRARPAKGETTVVEASRAHGAVARRAAESRATIPDFTVTVEAPLPASAAEAQVVSACGRALREHPRVNATYRDGAFELHSRANVGVVVPTADALAVPTIFDADTKPPEQIAEELAALTARAAAGELTPPELAGGTFTVSLLPVRRFTPLVVPGQAAALAVGTAGAPAELTLACDHRIVLPAEAAAFAGRIAELLAQAG